MEALVSFLLIILFWNDSTYMMTLPRYGQKPKAPPIKSQGIKTKLLPLIFARVKWGGTGRGSDKNREQPNEKWCRLSLPDKDLSEIVLTLAILGDADTR